MLNKDGTLAVCPRHPNGFDRSCPDVRCQQMWKPKGAPTRQEQLERWVAGKAVCPNENHECCPDFGCCHPKHLWPEEKRKKFLAASQGEREKMMMSALGNLLGDKTKTYITRGNPIDME